MSEQLIRVSVCKNRTKLENTGRGRHHRKRRYARVTFVAFVYPGWVHFCYAVCCSKVQCVHDVPAEALSKLQYRS